MALTPPKPGLNLVRFQAAAEVVPDAERLTVHGQRASCGVVPLPDPGRAIGQIAVVAARREEETPVSDRRIDSFRYDAVLKKGFRESIRYRRR